MPGSVGEIAERVLAEVRSAKLTKLAEHQMVKEASEKPRARTPIGQALLKFAEEVRAQRIEVSEEDLEKFVYGR
jgi:hypothetical protein